MSVYGTEDGRGPLRLLRQLTPQRRAGRFGASIAGVGDVDRDGYHGKQIPGLFAPPLLFT